MPCGYMPMLMLKNDFLISNNEDYYMGLIYAAYDPNDKNGFVNAFYIDTIVDTIYDQFNYLIRFQNTGNYPARNVVIRDSLSNLLDVGSLQIVGSSHNVFYLLI